MERQSHIHFGSVKHAIPHHHFRAANLFSVVAFLGWLETKLDRACQLIAMSIQYFRDGKPDGGMTIVSTGVHDARVL